MAKGGTNRGGARPGAGRPRKTLAEKVSEGKRAEVLMQPAELKAADVPPVREFMTAMQRDGTKLQAEDVYREVYEWLKARSCETLVSRQLIEQYAMSVSRWMHCEEVVSHTVHTPEQAERIEQEQMYLQFRQLQYDAKNPIADKRNIEFQLWRVTTAQNTIYVSDGSKKAAKPKQIHAVDTHLSFAAFSALYWADFRSLIRFFSSLICAFSSMFCSSMRHQVVENCTLALRKAYQTLKKAYRHSSYLF